MALLALGGRPQPLGKPSQSQKGHFNEKLNALIDTQTPELSKSAKETENICDHLWHLSRRGWIKCNYPNNTTGLKTTQMLHKNKACCRAFSKAVF